MSTELSSGMVCFDVDGYTPSQVVEGYHRQKITASTSPYQASHARLAPSLFNNEEEVQQTAEVIAKM